ncbi:hypothetical protein HanPI659440_Chr14g0525491 [Helianthus annuus]|nr:hypothetical protein HanPI659440_Chr14g0525491 [Helianthus annuus]
MNENLVLYFIVDLENGSVRVGSWVKTGFRSGRVRVRTGQSQKRVVFVRVEMGSGRNGFGPERVRVETGPGQNVFRVGSFWLKKVFF